MIRFLHDSEIATDHIDRRNGVFDRVRAEPGRTRGRDRVESLPRPELPGPAACPAGVEVVAVRRGRRLRVRFPTATPSGWNGRRQYSKKDAPAAPSKAPVRRPVPTPER